jgi:CRP/FNR family transcriptional regulator
VRPVTACSFRRTAFRAFLDRKPHLLRRLHEAASHELTLAQEHMVLLGRGSARERVLLFLLDLRTRWARICGKASVTVPVPMGRADIGDYLGLTIETVSRTLNQLAREKRLLIVPDGIRFLDLDAVEELAGA